MTLKGLRVNAGVSQNSIANELGITQSAYSKKENNPDSFKPSEIKKISDILKLTVKEVFDCIL